MYQILRGVDFLHSNRIVHRDLKPQNVLVAANGDVKLADFGLARIYEHSQILTTVVVTLWYRAPEVLLQSSYASPVDLWSCGCIFAELYRRKPLFCGQSESDQLTKIFEVIGSPQQTEWPAEVSLSYRSFAGFRRKLLQELIPEICPEGKDMLENLLVFNERRRLSASQCLSHEYFREFELFPPVYGEERSSSSQSSNRPTTSDDSSPT